MASREQMTGERFDPFSPACTDRPIRPIRPEAPKAAGAGITGYRNLTPAEIDLINSIKLRGEDLQTLIERVGEHLSKQATAAVRPGDGSPDEIRRIDQAQPYKWTAVAQTHFQQGLMALTRAVAQPRGF